MLSSVSLDGLLTLCYIFTLVWIVSLSFILLERKRQQKLPHYISQMKPLPVYSLQHLRYPASVHPLEKASGGADVIFSDVSPTAESQQLRTLYRDHDAELIVIQIDAADARATREARSLSA